jgi:hypothetical protein
MRSLVAFDLSSLDGTTIVLAELRLYKYHDGGSVQGRLHGVHRISESWSESVNRYGRLDYESGATDTDTVEQDVDGWMVWDVTSDGQAFAGGTYANHGWLIRDSSEEPSLYSNFRTREYSGTTYDPVLEVTYIP